MNYIYYREETRRYLVFSQVLRSHTELLKEAIHLGNDSINDLSNKEFIKLYNHGQDILKLLQI